MVPTSQQSSLRRISEDTKLRPFLSPLFDAQSYIKTIIKEGKSEECFSNIVGCIDEINVEIKGYISQHKDDLMSGMQDVAALADRYTNLSITSQKLHRNVGRLKKEADESYGLVSSRTGELECIHATSIMLHQLKQFVHHKRVLDAYLQNPDDTDLRNLSNVARTVSELEKLLQSPRLLEVQLVSDCAGSIKTFGKDIRVLAQDRLLKAIAEKNQASIASALQVFYNLESLPEVILLAIDSAVHRTVENSRSALDIESIQILLQEAPGAGAGAAGGAGAPPSATKKPLVTSHTVTGATAGAGSSSGSAAQVRIAVREMAHVWSSMIHEMAMQVHVLQRVVAKKEDPTTHEKFITVLQNAQHLQAHTHHSTGTASARTTTSLLSRGLLLDLFWYRLSESLHDVAADKVKHFALASSRAYPYIRKAAVEILQNLRSWTDGEGAVRAPGSWLLNADGDSGAGGSLQLEDGSDAPAGDTEDGAGSDQLQGGYGGGMFGSLQWSQDDLLNSVSAYSSRGRTAHTRSTHPKERRGEGAAEAEDEGGARLDPAQASGEQLMLREPKEHHLVLGLKPMRDKYLITALGRMSAPIAQMFPELEGYTAAVPSKRDLLALTKAIHSEFSTALIESDVGLVQLVSREFLKTIKLMLSKIEGMVMHTSDSRALSAANNFARTHAQVHNSSLLVLLVQLKEALQKIPGQVQTAGADAASSVLMSSSVSGGGGQAGSGAGSAQSSASTAQLQQDVKDIDRAVGLAVHWIEDLAQRQILEPIVSVISSFVTSSLVLMQKEGVVGALPGAVAPSPGPGTPAAGGYTGKAPPSAQQEASLECSAAVQSLLKHLPIILKTHLFSLPKCDAVSRATEEVYVRTLHSYVTVAALLRPVTEALRLRTTKDMAALEQLLSSLYTLPRPNDCPVLREFRAFRRLLFLQENNADSTAVAGTPAQNKAKNAAAPSNAPPDARELLKLTYISHLRPSTLLGYLVSCAPPQLPSPFDTGAGALAASTSDIAGYVDMLTDVFLTQRTQHAQNTSTGASGVRDLYAAQLDKWRLVANEAQSWALTQQALDTFFQRVSVASGDQKVKMRLWYETIIEIGSRTF